MLPERGRIALDPDLDTWIRRAGGLRHLHTAVLQDHHCVGRPSSTGIGSPVTWRID